MKKLILIALGALILISCSKNTNKETGDIDPYKSAQESFKNEYPEIIKVNWEKEGEFYEATFIIDGMEITVLYDADGNVILKEFEIMFEDLPLNIPVFIAENYTDSEIEEAEKILKEEEVYFEVEIELSNNKEVELLFDEDGSFIKELVEEEQQIDPSELPQAALDYIDQNYPDHIISEAEKIEKEIFIYYEAELTGSNGKEIDLIFDGEGNFIKTE